MNTDEPTVAGRSTTWCPVDSYDLDTGLPIGGGPSPISRGGIDAWTEAVFESNRWAMLTELQKLDEREADIYAYRAQLMNDLRGLAEDEYLMTSTTPAPYGAERTIPDNVVAGVIAEIAAARRLPRGTVEIELAEAHVLRANLPNLREATHNGEVWQRHARAVLNEAAPVLQAHRDARAELDAAERRADVAPEQLESLREHVAATAEHCLEYELAGIEYAQKFTPPVVRDKCRKLAARLLGLDAEQRHKAARAKREVRIYSLPDGMSELVATLPTLHATAILDRLTKQATALARAQDQDKRAAADRDDHTNDTGGPTNDTHADGPTDDADGNIAWRSFDQLRADVFTDMLLTAEPSDVHGSARGIDATISIVVPILTVLGHDTEPATLNGVSPIPMDDALRFTATAPGWLRVLTDPITGVCRELDTYRPNKALRALIGARDLACRFPGCRRPARDCDIDHILAWAHHGKTRDTNLEALCQRDHTIKHTTAWRVEPDPDHPGGLVWTSPAGAIHTTTPAAIGPTFTPTELERLRSPQDPPGPPPF